MASNNSEINAAINEATMALRALHPEDSERLLDAAYAKRGLTRRKRLSPEAKAARDLAEKQAKAKAKIDEIAAKADLQVLVAKPVDVEALREVAPEVAERIDQALDGTAPRVTRDLTQEEIAAEQRYREAFEGGQPIAVSTIVIPE